MPDSPSPETERGVQPLFRKTNIFSSLAIFVAVMAFDAWLKTVEVRSDGPALQAAVRFVPVKFDPGGFSPLRLAGAWQMEVEDPRFGGVSALAMDGDALLALTDSGSVIRFPKPGRGTRALVRDLPAGPGIPQFKANRDSEALMRDPAGRGWWVAFEHWHQLWLYDRAFSRPLTRIELGTEWRANAGVEAMVADGRGMLLLRETGDEWVRLEAGKIRRHPLNGRYGSLSDAVRLPDGRILAVARNFAFGGFNNRLLTVEKKDGSLRLRPFARLKLGRLDNVEALAAEPLGRGGTRLWLMTDNDFRPRKRTLLVAVDLP